VWRRLRASGDAPLLPDLGGRVWLLVLVNCVANAGSGLTLPYLIVYLHTTRGIPLDRGRYNAVFTLSWQIGPVIGPVFSGFMLAHARGDELLFVLAGACGAAAIAARGLGRLIPSRVDVPRNIR
jgi:MFS family permease